MSRKSPASFRTWAEAAKPGDEFVYYNTKFTRDPKMFAVARELFDANKAILFQRRRPIGTWEYVAERVSDRAAGWINRLSKTVPAPYNPLAHTFEPAKVFGSAYGRRSAGSSRRREAGAL